MMVYLMGQERVFKHYFPYSESIQPPERLFCRSLQPSANLTLSSRKPFLEPGHLAAWIKK